MHADQDEHTTENSQPMPAAVPPQQRRNVSFVNLTQSAIEANSETQELRARVADLEHDKATLQRHLDVGHTQMRVARLACRGCDPDDGVPAPVV